MSYEHSGNGGYGNEKSATDWAMDNYADPNWNKQQPVPSYPPYDTAWFNGYPPYEDYSAQQPEQYSPQPAQQPYQYTEQQVIYVPFANTNIAPEEINGYQNFFEKQRDRQLADVRRLNLQITNLGDIESALYNAQSVADLNVIRDSVHEMVKAHSSTWTPPVGFNIASSAPAYQRHDPSRPYQYLPGSDMDTPPSVGGAAMSDWIVYGKRRMDTSTPPNGLSEQAYMDWYTRLKPRTVPPLPSSGWSRSPEPQPYKQPPAQPSYGYAPEPPTQYGYPYPYQQPPQGYDYTAQPYAQPEAGQNPQVEILYTPEGHIPGISKWDSQGIHNELYPDDRINFQPGWPPGTDPENYLIYPLNKDSAIYNAEECTLTTNNKARIGGGGASGESPNSQYNVLREAYYKDTDGECRIYYYIDLTKRMDKNGAPTQKVTKNGKTGYPFYFPDGDYEVFDSDCIGVCEKAFYSSKGKEGFALKVDGEWKWTERFGSNPESEAQINDELQNLLGAAPNGGGARTGQRPQPRPGAGGSPRQSASAASTGGGGGRQSTGSGDFSQITDEILHELGDEITGEFSELLQSSDEQQTAYYEFSKDGLLKMLEDTMIMKLYTDENGLLRRGYSPSFNIDHIMNSDLGQTLFPEGGRPNDHQVLAKIRGAQAIGGDKITNDDLQGILDNIFYGKADSINNGRIRFANQQALNLYCQRFHIQPDSIVQPSAPQGPESQPGGGSVSGVESGQGSGGSQSKELRQYMEDRRALLDDGYEETVLAGETHGLSFNDKDVVHDTVPEEYEENGATHKAFPVAFLSVGNTIMAIAEDYTYNNGSAVSTRLLLLLDDNEGSHIRVEIPLNDEGTPDDLRKKVSFGGESFVNTLLIPGLSRSTHGWVWAYRDGDNTKFEITSPHSGSVHVFLKERTSEQSEGGNQSGGERSQVKFSVGDRAYCYDEATHKYDKEVTISSGPIYGTGYSGKEIAYSVTESNGNRYAIFESGLRNKAS